MKYLPAFVVGMLSRVSMVLTGYFGINLPELGLKKDALGAIVVTSVCNLGFQNAYALFFRFIWSVYGNDCQRSLRETNCRLIRENSCSKNGQYQLLS